MVPHDQHMEDAWTLGQGRLMLAWTTCYKQDSNTAETPC